jgi:pimeloyl-ACP methyl ester carboxylesterase
VEQTKLYIGESELECFSHGEGIPIVMLPGGSLSVDYLHDLAETLADTGFQAVRVNPRGAGASTGPMRDLSLHDYAADVVGVIEALNTGPAFVWGHAFGNRIARTVAADRPDLVRGVILVAAGGKIPPRPEAQQALATLFTPTASETQILEAMKWMVGSPENASAVWDRFKSSRAPGAAAAQMSAAQSTPLTDWWAPPGTLPYLVIQGTNDEAAPAENGHLLKAELGDRVTLVDIPGAGHLQPLEAPEPIAKAVINFAH